MFIIGRGKVGCLLCIPTFNVWYYIVENTYSIFMFNKSSKRIKFPMLVTPFNAIAWGSGSPPQS